MAGNDYAVLVGISKYPALKDLSGPVVDALYFKDWLTGRGGVPEQHIELILTPDNLTMSRRDARPLRDQVIDALDAVLANENEQGKAGRRLYLYFAGHGYAPQLDEAALLMANAGGRSFPAIPGTQFANWIRASAKFEEIVLVMDCCREEYGQIPPQPLPWPEEISPEAGRVRYFHAYATQPYLFARETPLPPDYQIRGIFTFALLTAFEQTSPDANGCITGSAVKGYVLNLMKQLIGEQYQEPEIPIDSARDIVLWQTDTIAKQPVVFHLPAACGREVRIVDGSLELAFAGAVPADGVLRLELGAGKYRIDTADLGCGQRFDVLGAPGEVIHVQL